MYDYRKEVNSFEIKMNKGNLENGGGGENRTRVQEDYTARATRIKFSFCINKIEVCEKKLSKLVRRLN